MKKQKIGTENKSTVEGVGVQNHFLNEARRQGLEVVISLKTGEKLEGRIKGFDSYTVLFKYQGKESLVFKAAICSIFRKAEATKGRLKRVKINTDNKALD